MPEPHCRLLVSVRSAAEAEAALAGGADLIDIKEPTRGSLGRADDRVIADILRQVAGRRPVSAALGELWDARHSPSPPTPRSACGKRGEEKLTPKQKLPASEERGEKDSHSPVRSRFPSSSILTSLCFLKWGLSCCRSQPWRDWLRGVIGNIETSHEASQVVAAAYADAALADAPPVSEIVAFACTRPGSVLLIDTFAKDNSKNLLDWLSVQQLAAIQRQCRAANVRLALAGSLREGDIASLLPLQPDWLAVRGAACEQGRTSAICAEKVRRLAQQIHGADMSLHGS